MDDDAKYAESFAEAIEAHRKFARDAVEQGAELAAARIARGVYDFDEAAQLSDCVDSGRNSLDAVAVYLDAIARHDPHAGTLAWYFFGTAIENMYCMGGLLSISRAADIHSERYNNKVRIPARRRDVKKEKLDGPRTAALDSAILACVDGERSKLSSYTDAMVPSRDDVLKRLPEQFIGKSWPSEWTIRTRILVLKKDR
jgi:hypothetical protein